MAAWTLFGRDSRATLCSRLNVDSDTWQRSRGWALTRIFNVAYYRHSDPRFSRDARRTINEVLTDH